jgi:hypothetical protein
MKANPRAAPRFRQEQAQRQTVAALDLLEAPSQGSYELTRSAGSSQTHGVTGSAAQRLRLAMVLMLSWTTALGCLVSGCRSAPRQSTTNPRIHPQEDIRVTQEQLRVRMRALVGPMCARLEQAADSIIASTDDEKIKQAALQWKIDGVPALRQALFQTDPFVALTDTWVLCYQMSDYFQDGPGHQALGRFAGEAVAACQRLEETIYRIASSGTHSGDVSKARGVARGWAREHPVGQAISGRESTLSGDFGRNFAQSLSVGQAAAEATTTLGDLSRKLDVYSGQVFRQARWEAERLESETKDALAKSPATAMAQRSVASAEQATAALELAAHTLQQLSPAIQKALEALAEAPPTLVQERVATMKTLHEELTQTLRFATDERTAVLEAVGQERALAMKDLERTLDEQRKAMARDAERVSLMVVDHANRKVQQLAIFTLTAVILAGFLGLLLAGRSLRRQG